MNRQEEPMMNKEETDTSPRAVRLVAALALLAVVAVPLLSRAGAAAAQGSSSSSDEEEELCLFSGIADYAEEPVAEAGREPAEAVARKRALAGEFQRRAAER